MTDIDIEALESRWEGMPGSAGPTKEIMRMSWERQLNRMQEGDYNVGNDDDMLGYLYEFGPWEIKELLRCARLLEDVAGTLQKVRDQTDATKTPNFTVREVLLIRHLCDQALGRIDNEVLV